MYSLPRLLSALSFTSLLIIGFSAPVVAQFAGGSGTEADPYQVATAKQLDEVRNHLDAHFVQTADIDLAANSNWEPIGAGGNPFTGSYDGANRTITNLTIDRPNEWDQGLFGVATNATLSNIHLHDVTIVGQGGSGGLAAILDGGQVFNSHVSASISIELGTAGGLIGYAEGDSEIHNSSSIVLVTGQSHVGGLVGRNDGDVIQSSSVANFVVIESQHGDSFGGLVGYNDGTIYESFAAGHFEAKADIAGGLAGWNSGVISHSTAAVTITGTVDFVGGLVGFNAGGATITDSQAKGDVGGGRLVGGLVGTNFDEGMILSSHAWGNVVATAGDGAGLSASAGGLVGANGILSEVLDSSAHGEVTGLNRVGGLVGLSWGIIARSHATGATTGQYNVGGLVGVSQYETVERSYATGPVQGTDHVGGLIGWNSLDSHVSESYALGPVSGAEAVGGLIGGNDASVDQSYAAGLVDGKVDVGGFIGLSDAVATVDDSYWDTEASEQEHGLGSGTPEGLTGLTTEEMTGENAEQNMDALDFGEVWVVTDAYPALYWQEEEVLEPTIPALQRQVLLALYQTTGGDDWSDNAGWKMDGEFSPSGTEADWYGVSVEDGKVIQIDLSGNALSGVLPSAIGKLVTLDRLWLFDNELGGSLPPSLMNIPPDQLSLRFHDTALCEPPGEAFQGWLAQLAELESTGEVCEEAAAVASAMVEADGMQQFGKTGVEVDFSGVTSPGQVHAERFASAPGDPDGIEHENVVDQRLVITASPELEFSSAELRLDMEDFGTGIDDLESATIYARPVPGVGAFEPLPTEFDDGAGRLIAHVESFGEFAVGHGPKVATEDGSLQEEFALRSIHPNPSLGEVTIEVALPAHSALRVEVLDLIGRRVALLADGVLPAGTHSLRWDGLTAAGSPAAAGLYLVRAVNVDDGTTLTQHLTRVR